MNTCNKLILHISQFFYSTFKLPKHTQNLLLNSLFHHDNKVGHMTTGLFLVFLRLPWSSFQVFLSLSECTYTCFLTSSVRGIDLYFCSLVVLISPQLLQLFKLYYFSKFSVVKCGRTIQHMLQFSHHHNLVVKEISEDAVPLMCKYLVVSFLLIVVSCMCIIY